MRTSPFLMKILLLNYGLGYTDKHASPKFNIVILPFTIKTPSYIRIYTSLSSEDSISPTSAYPAVGRFQLANTQVCEPIGVRSRGAGGTIAPPSLERGHTPNMLT